jgi:hypothetical protein
MNEFIEFSYEHRYDKKKMRHSIDLGNSHHASIVTRFICLMTDKGSMPINAWNSTLLMYESLAHDVLVVFYGLDKSIKMLNDQMTSMFSFLSPIRLIFIRLSLMSMLPVYKTLTRWTIEYKATIQISDTDFCWCILISRYMYKRVEYKSSIQNSCWISK